MKRSRPVSTDYMHLATLKVESDCAPSLDREVAYIEERARLLSLSGQATYYQIVNSRHYISLKEALVDLFHWSSQSGRSRLYGLCGELKSYVEWVRDVHFRRVREAFFPTETPVPAPKHEPLFMDVANTHYLMLLDPEDFEHLSAYTVGLYNTMYPYARGGSVHRGVMARAGHDISGKLIDHVNNNRFDARKQNLRFCTRQQNRCNNARVINSTGYRGLAKVNLANGRVIYQAVIAHDGRMEQIGRFDGIEEAAIAWDIYARRYHGEFARLNKPDASQEDIDRVQKLIDTPRTTSRFYGVSWNSTHKRWKGRVTLDKIEHLVGYFKDEEEAARAVDRKRIELRMNLKKLNFPR